MKIRVANIIEEGKFGGPQKRILQIASFIKDNVETVVIFPRENSALFEQKLKDNLLLYKKISLSRITKDPFVASRFLLFSWYEILRLAHYFRRKKFDIVHVSGGSWQYKGVLAGKLANSKVIWHLNDTYAPWIIRKLFAMLSRFADAYIFASVRSFEYYAPLIKPKKPFFIIPAPVDTKYFSPQFQDKRSNKEISWKKNKNKMVIGTIANISPIKDLETFIKVAHLVNNYVNNAEFIIVGKVYNNQKRYFKKLQKLSSDLNMKNLFFLGGKDDVRSILEYIDIYLCTSKAESSPMSIWEAMSMGKPVVSTLVGDVPIYIEHGISGELAEVGDVEHLAKGVLTLILDESKRQQYGLINRKVAISTLDIKFSALKHLDAYNSVLSLN